MDNQNYQSSQQGGNRGRGRGHGNYRRHNDFNGGNSSYKGNNRAYIQSSYNEQNNRPYRNENRGQYNNDRPRRPIDKTSEDHGRDSSPDRNERSRPKEKDREDHTREPSPDRSNINDTDVQPDNTNDINSSQSSQPGEYPRESNRYDGQQDSRPESGRGGYDRHYDRRPESGRGGYDRQYDRRPESGRGGYDRHYDRRPESGRGGYDRQYDRRPESGRGGYDRQYGRRPESGQQRDDRWSNYKEDKSDIQLSKALSFLLRHGAEKQGYTFLPGGFLYVEDILYYQRNLQGYTIDDIDRVVKSNDKQRFFMEKEEETGKWKIRANQGHTLQVEGLDLKPITSKDEVEVVIHGTYLDSWRKIKESGLSRMGRNHIHFAAGEPGENGVISGMRTSCEVMIYVDLEKALKDGLKFFRSANNVILCAGNDNGVIPPAYFKQVMQRFPRQRLDYDEKLKEPSIPVGGAGLVSNKSGKKKKNKKGKGGKENEEETKSKKEKHEIDAEAEEDVEILFQEDMEVGESSGTTGTAMEEDTTPPNNWEEDTTQDKEEYNSTQNASQSKTEEFHDAENSSDVIVESVEDITLVEDVESSISALEYLRDQDVVAMYFDWSDDTVSRIVCANKEKAFVFDLLKFPELMEKGKLADFFNSTATPLKVFDGLTSDMSAMLFNNYKIILNGTQIFDLKIAYRIMKEQGSGNITDLKKTGYDPDSSTPLSDDSDINTLLQKSLKGYTYLIGLVKNGYKKELFDMVNEKIDKNEMKKLKEQRKKDSKQQPSQEPSTESQQHTTSPKKKGKNKKK